MKFGEHVVMSQITLIIYAENRRFWPFLAILWTSQLCNLIKPVILGLGKCRLVKNMFKALTHSVPKDIPKS